MWPRIIKQIGTDTKYDYCCTNSLCYQLIKTYFLNPFSKTVLTISDNVTLRFSFTINSAWNCLSFSTSFSSKFTVILCGIKNHYHCRINLNYIDKDILDTILLHFLVFYHMNWFFWLFLNITSNPWLFIIPFFYGNSRDWFTIPNICKQAFVRAVRNVWMLCFFTTFLTAAFFHWKNKTGLLVKNYQYFLSMFWWLYFALSCRFDSFFDKVPNTKSYTNYNHPITQYAAYHLCRVRIYFKHPFLLN